MDPALLHQHLSGPPLTVEIHDRDRIVEKQKLKPTLFGDDLEDEKISNVGTVSSECHVIIIYGVCQLGLFNRVIGDVGVGVVLIDILFNCLHRTYHFSLLLHVI